MRVINPVTAPIDRILNAFWNLITAIFGMSSSTGYFNQLIATIMNSPLLLVCVSLMVIGFVIGILKRLITA